MWAGIIAREVDRWSAVIGRPIELVRARATQPAFVGIGRACPASGYLGGHRGDAGVRTRVAAWFADFDVMMLPRCPEPAFLLGRINAAAPDPFAELLDSAALMTFTMPFNLTGQPAMSLPLGTARDGLPDRRAARGAVRREDVLFRLASQLEAAQPWADRHPSVAAV